MKTTITITVNGKPLQAPKGVTVSSLLESIGLTDGVAVAVEVNRAIIPRVRHHNHTLSSGDTVEIVTFAGGG